MYLSVQNEVFTLVLLSIRNYDVSPPIILEMLFDVLFFNRMNREAKPTLTKFSRS